jgi:chromosome segregation ATPase
MAETTHPTPRPAAAPTLEQALSEWKEKALAEQAAHVERLQRARLTAEEALAAVQRQQTVLAQAAEKTEERLKDLQALQETAEREYAKVLYNLQTARVEIRAINTAKGLAADHAALTDAVAKLRVTRGELEAHVAALEKRRAAVQGALDELKARLG